MTAKRNLLGVFFLLVGCWADVYMHNPRGSNDRNCERNVNRNNGNRLFDSQNNNNGGYACQRAVGDGSFQAEDGTATFQYFDPDSGTTKSFTQNKRMYYYSGSILPIEWTNQHGCGGNSKVSCEIVLQYACEDTLDPSVDNFWPWVQNKGESTTTYYGKQHFRSGGNIAAPRDGVPIDSNDAATDTIPDNEESAIANTDATRRYGMHESYDQYQLCQRTQRNKGLYTADQRINRNDQRGTRQNPNGNRRGLECPEERDYYPWWHPSPWIDIAVLSDSAGDDVCYSTNVESCTKRCQYYMNNTMNWNPKGYCDVNHTDPSATVQTKLTNARWTGNQWYNNKKECTTAGFAWYEVSHADNLMLANNSFVCAHTQYSRSNQLGNGRGDTVISQTQMESMGIVKDAVNQGVNANRFLWTIPEIPTAKSSAYFPSGMASAYKSCSLRIRYNISSADFQQWPEDAVDEGTSRMVDWRNNSRFLGDTVTPLRQDPYVYIGPGDNAQVGSMFVKLKVNTNQYGRTFQDRSYSFSIKSLPTASADASNRADTPAVDVTAMQNALLNGGKIYNVNVRGKRGNIVQVYPSVEYDFVPNALALGTNDMVHFQWTGSDYNPRRGCNDATGGPPDANTFFTDANANQNPRADRSNVMFTYHMGNNVPKNYLGYDMSANLTYAQKVAYANSTVLGEVPCYDPATDSGTIADACYEQVMRLAYLNQQSDSGSLTLRQGRKCLTADELDAIPSQDVADFHPLNCAKMNAKPYTYFDGGLMFMRKKGWFSYYSSRNNNFSNRQQIGVICVGEDCKVKNGTDVLEDTNPMTNGASKTAEATSTSACFDTAGGENGANANGVTSCLPADANTPNSNSVLKGESFATQEGDNDNKGDGNAKGCATLSFASGAGSSVESNVGLAIGLLFVGLFCSWAAYYLYNRYQARLEGQSKFRYDTAWQKASAPDKCEAGESFSGVNPGVAMTRIRRTDSAKAAAAGAAAMAAAPSAASGGSAAASPVRSSSARASSPQRAGSPVRASARAMPLQGARPASNAKVSKRYEMI
mmetsp:Transcript_122180/g.239865  ORF Transcript_122180/g.239865 Transcript_122180/m.239865 type:complete len:1043 (+) Transcript_122180:57-3185(+)